jgi:hypothetical protein
MGGTGQWEIRSLLTVLTVSLWCPISVARPATTSVDHLASRMYPLVDRAKWSATEMGGGSHYNGAPEAATRRGGSNHYTGLTDFANQLPILLLLGCGSPRVREAEKLSYGA